MTGPVLYELIIPAQIALKNQILTLRKSQEWWQEQGRPLGELSKARLVPDMFPLPFHVTFCANYLCQALLDLGVLDSNIKAPDMNPHDEKYEELVTILERVSGYLDTIKPDQFAGKETMTMYLRGRTATKEFVALDNFQKNIMPSFWFHNTMVYAILRIQGIPLTKGTHVWGIAS